ncbi:MAG: TlpA family protein disulfide reductase [Acidobacteria bacterium]|nr:TlpA family protein disulfide reductase [Acidobacteriota bacterium]MBA3806096.1 TlpA family protein disulfide reductase [Acidobacteriota bacterium]
MKCFWKTISLAALALIVGASFVGCSLNNRTADATTQAMSKTAADATTVGTAVGNTAPDFQLAQMDGSPVSLAALRGQPAVLVFWTAWCPVCKEEAPHFNELAAKYEPKGVRVVGINIQDSLARTQSGIKDFGIRYAVARDADASVARLYHVSGTPTVVFLDKRGVVSYFANSLPDDYAQRLDSLAAE